LRTFLRAAYLLTTNFSEEQRREVLKATDKNRAYSRQITANHIGEAGRAVFDLRQAIRKNTIYLPEALTSEFKEAIELMSAAQIERRIGFQHADAYDRYERSQKMLAEAEPLFERLSVAVRGRIFRL